MFYLIFEYKPKHQKAAYSMWRSPKPINRSSTHNQLELDVIRKSIKSRWACAGFGTADYQKKIWEVEDILYGKDTAKDNRLHHFMNGHIITVDEVQDVVWFRLNFENVSKNGCRLIEIYQDMDLAEFERLGNELRVLGAEREAMNRVIRNVESYKYNIDHIEQREPAFMRLPQAKDYLDFKAEARDFAVSIREEVIAHTAKIAQKGEVFFNLLDSKRTLID